MRLGFIPHQNGRIQFGSLTKQLSEQSKYCLFQVKYSPQVQMEYVEEFGEIYGKAKEAAGLPVIMGYLYSIDPLSNTISVCPPIVEGESGRVIFRQSEYELAIRDKGWPVDHIDCGPLLALIGYSPNGEKGLGVDNQAENPTITVVK